MLADLFPGAGRTLKACRRFCFCQLSMYARLGALAHGLSGLRALHSGCGDPSAPSHSAHKRTRRNSPGRRQALPASCPSRSPPRPREQFRHFPLKRLWSRAFLNRRVLQNADSLRKVFLITLGNIAAALPVPAHAAAFLLPQCLPTRIFRPGLFSKFRPAPQTAVSELGKLSGTLYSSLRRTNVHQSVFSSLPLALSSDPPSLFLVIEDYV